MPKKTIRQALIEANRKFSKTSPSPDLDAEVILSHVLKKSRESVLSNLEKKLTKQQASRYKLLTNRRVKGLPVAYIVGYKEFYGQQFTVNPHVLIPRPETESLIDLVLHKLKKYKPPAKRCKLLDLGTGSGCIAVTLSRLLAKRKSDKEEKSNNWVFCASDISHNALKVAKINAKTHGVKIKFICSDLFKKLPEKFDLIIANLPYVRYDDYLAHRNQLAYEPKKALTDTTNRWLIYQRFFQQLPGHLNPSSLCFLEIDPQSKQIITTYCRRYFKGAKLRFHKDLMGKYRFAVLQT